MRPLHRPMFRYGGPIKEGIMSGIRESKRKGGSMGTHAALVGNPIFPKTAGREHHQIDYRFNPKDLNPNLREAAARNVRTHLEKLSEEGKIEETSPLYSLNNN